MAYPAPSGGLSLFLVRDGRQIGRAHVRLSCDRSALEAIEAILQEWQHAQRVDGGSADGMAGEPEVDLLLRWIYRHAGSPNLVPWPPGRPARDVAAAILSVADLDQDESEL
jgi:hypothetical protein